MGGMAPQGHHESGLENHRGINPGAMMPAMMRRTIAAHQRALLTQAIEAGVIPHLLRLNPVQDELNSIDATDIAAFASHVILDLPDLARETVARLQASGISVDAIYLDLFAPCARLLGDRWMEDLCDFSQVTLGVGRMQRILHELSAGLDPSRMTVLPGRRILLASVPGEQHTFGVSMVAEFFSRAGWQTRCKPRIEADAFADLMKSEWFEIVGLSAGSDVRLHSVASVIRIIRRISRNPAIGILVGGPAFRERPDAVAEVGADATAADGREAVVQAGRLLAHPARIV